MASTKKKAGEPAVLTEGKTRLGTYRERFLARVAELEAHEAVKVLSAGVGDPVDPAVLDAAAAKYGVTLTDEERELYARMDGCWLVWVGVEAAEYDKKIHKLKKGLPRPSDLKELDLRAFRVIAMPPLAEVFGKPLDYASFMGAGEPPRLGFDFPGEYTTPALVVRDGRIRVEVGDDHGAAWDGRGSSLEDYVETILATYGDVELRRAIYLKGKHGVGRAHFEAHPIALESLLPTPLPKDAQAEAKLLRVLNRTYGKDLKDAQIAQAVGAVGSANAELVSVAMMRLLEQPERARVHADKLVDALATCRDPRSLTRVIEEQGAPLSLDQRERLLRGKGSIEARGRIAAGAGPAILPALRELLTSTNADDFMAAAYAVMRLGPAAAELTPLLEPRLGAPDFEARSKWASFDGKLTPSLLAAAALISLVPARTGDLYDHARIVLRSDLLRFGRQPGRTLAASPHDLFDVLSRQDPAVRDRLSRELCDVLAENLSSGASHPANELLGALGDPGIDRAFELVAAHDAAPTTDAAFNAHMGALGGALFRATLDDTQRARAASVAKRVLVDTLAGGARAEYLALVLHFGGSPEPEVGAAETNDRLLGSAGSFLSFPLCQRTFEILRERGLGRAVLEPKAQSYLGHYNWTGQDGWLRRYIASLG